MTARNFPANANYGMQGIGKYANKKAYARWALFKEVFQLVLYDPKQAPGFVSSLVPVDILVKFVNISYQFIDQLTIPFRLGVTFMQFIG